MMEYKSQPIVPVYGIEGFINDLSVPETYHGMACVIRKNFTFILEDDAEHIKAATDISGEKYIELRRTKKCKSEVRWECYFQGGNSTSLLWYISRDGKYFSSPVVVSEAVSALRHLSEDVA